MAEAADTKGKLPIPLTATAVTNGIRIVRARLVAELIAF